VSAAFDDFSLLQLALIVAAALVASLVGGVSGYGSGALLPLVLVPIVGPEPVVPIIAISALFTNTSRAMAFHAAIDWRRTLIILAAAIPTCLLAAWGYTRLSGAGVMVVIGAMLIASVPVRRLLTRRGYRLGDAGLAVSAVGWGGIVGGTAGAGIILLSMLMAAGVAGAGVIATDAAISIVVSLMKIAVFGVAGVYSVKVVAIALLIGLVAFPGAFLARAIVRRLPLGVHTAILDCIVVLGGLTMLLGASTL
jgi:uncharacterized membrane protein YfcA